MQPIKTQLTELLGITTPIMSAPMGYTWSADLACAVHKAGGFGLVGAAFDTSEQLRHTLGRVRTALGVPAGKALPVGVGLVGWVLDQTEASEDPRIPTVLDAQPALIYFAFGADLGRHVAAVRAHERGSTHRTLVAVCVSTVEEARRAADEWHADILVAQGFEAGGHSSVDAPPVSILVAGVLAALPGGPPVVAAGGVATGAQAAALLTLGAAGVLLGTRLLFTDECGYTPAQKAAVVRAGHGAAAHAACLDEVMGLTWPRGVVGHGLVNGVVRDAQEGLPLEERKRRYDEGRAQGDTERLIVWAGKGVGLTSEIRPAGEVIVQLHEEAVAALRRAASLL
ncbi:nitronate monooxygenase [Phanerochaete sordida]|uniref:Nitronate monooxygenase n=1 Tax=Phanerochaete sordida TaxID=48140 RepID=A0A9P3LFY9_9APHY|nr:nitronate monooxygenase [Phanerochaete sordida]